MRVSLAPFPGWLLSSLPLLELMFLFVLRSRRPPRSREAAISLSGRMPHSNSTISTFHTSKKDTKSMLEKEEIIQSIDEIEIDSLDAEELEDVAGGWCLANSCSGTSCSENPSFTPG